MKQFDEWNDIKKNLGSKRKRPLVKKGEIFWCSVGINVGVEYDGKGDWYYKLPHLIASEESFVVLNQAKVYDTDRFEESLGELSETNLNTVNRTLLQIT